VIGHGVVWLLFLLALVWTAAVLGARDSRDGQDWRRRHRW
jgi:hypothetical protein